MSLSFRFSALWAGLSLAALAGCTHEEPYALYDYRFYQRGAVDICYSEAITTPDQALKAADEICQKYDRTAKLNYQVYYQCSWTAPTLAHFNCVAREGETPRPMVKKNAPLRHDPKIGDP